MPSLKPWLKSRLPWPILGLIRIALQSALDVKISTLRLVYRLTGIVPRGMKYRNFRAYWTARGKLLCEEDASNQAHSSPVQLAAREEFLAELAGFEFASILDAGCGYCRELVPVYDRFPGLKAFGIDFSPTVLQDAISYKRPRPIQLAMGDLTALPFVDDSFDVSFSTSVYQYIPPEKALDAFRELARVTKRRIYHREVYRKHIETNSELKRRFDISENLFDHKYEAAYKGMGHVVNSFVQPAYLGQEGREEIWYSLIVVELNKSPHFELSGSSSKVQRTVAW